MAAIGVGRAHAGNGAVTAAAHARGGHAGRASRFASTSCACAASGTRARPLGKKVRGEFGARQLQTADRRACFRTPAARRRVCVACQARQTAGGDGGCVSQAARESTRQCEVPPRGGWAIARHSGAPERQTVAPAFWRLAQRGLPAAGPHAAAALQCAAQAGRQAGRRPRELREPRGAPGSARAHTFDPWAPVGGLETLPLGHTRARRGFSARVTVAQDAGPGNPTDTSRAGPLVGNRHTLNNG